MDLDAKSQKSQKTNKQYSCDTCDYITHNKYDYQKHILTAKHLSGGMTRTNLFVLKSQDDCNPQYACSSCEKTYKTRSGFAYHKTRCAQAHFDESHCVAPQMDTSLVIELLKQNQEFKDLIIEQNKQMIELANKVGNTNCNNNNNTTNNKFNLNVFLNETCKDAITMDDFIKSFEVTRDEFLHTGKVGYIEGLSAVMTNRFRDMDVHTRPLHCTDLKRETIYIKNADKWEKDDAAKTHMRKAVRGVARKNKQEMWRWYDENKPLVEQIGTDVCEDYFQYHKSALGGYGKEEDLKFEDKIIHNVLSSVHVNKSTSLTI